MTTIPDRIWEEARQLRNVVNWTSNASVEAIAMFLLAAENRGREEERERCLRIADEAALECEWTDGVVEAGNIAAAIRSTN